MSSVISKCSSPVAILDKVKRGYMYVNCGKCDNCRHSYRTSWQTRLEDEASRSTATLFFTLTYDNQSIPTLTWDNSQPDILYSNRSEKDDIYLSDYQGNFKFRPQIQNFQNENTIGYCSKADVQKFFKRLRRYLEYDKDELLLNVPKEKRLFRYFVTSEYGPKTFRPHYHGLLYFDDVRVARAVETHYIYKAWQYSSSKNLNCSRVVSSASSYVAKYVNSITDLPDILKIPSKTACFFLCSRRPAIGVSFYDYTSLVAKVKRRDVKVNRLFTVNGVSTAVKLPLHASVIRFYFPKLYKSSSFDDKALFEFFTSVFRYVRRDKILKISHLSYRDMYDYISSLLPSYVSDVNKHLDNLSSIANRRVVLGDIYNSLTRDEKLFGIAQNRTALIRFLIYSSSTGFNISEYVYNYTTFYSLRFNDCFNYTVDLQNEIANKGYSSADIARYVYPSFFKSLPTCLEFLVAGKDIKLFSKSYDYYLNLSMMLNSLGLDINEVYPNGMLDSKYLEGLQDYTLTSEFVQYSNEVSDKALAFNKTRLTNHIINQNSLNYEVF